MPAIDSFSEMGYTEESEVQVLARPPCRTLRRTAEVALVLIKEEVLLGVDDLPSR